MAENGYIVLQNKIGFTVIVVHTYIIFFIFKTIKITLQYFSGF